MIKFLFRKTIYDGIDNLGMLVIFNALLALVPVCSGFLVSRYLAENLLLMFLGIFSVVFAESLLSLGINGIVYKWSCNSFGKFSDFRNAYKRRLKVVLFHSVIVFICIAMIPFSQVFFLYLGNFGGLLACLVLFWTEIVVFLCMQFYYPVSFYLENDGVFSVLKNSFALVSDNIGYCFFLMLRSAFDFVITILSASLVPGLCGICLSRMDTVRLLVLRYNYIKSTEGATKHNVLWIDVLKEEDKIIGKRNIRTLLFPWKDKNKSD